VAAVIARAETQSGGALDLVIANAGIGMPTPARKLDWQKVQRIFHVNTTAAAVTVSAALPAMVIKDKGTVVAISSLAAFRGLPDNGAYSASKAALRTFMEGLRVDLRGTQVRALTIYPGFVKTPLTAKNKFSMPFILELDDAVARMVRGIERGQRSVRFPLPLSLGTRLLASLPDWMYEALAGKR
jgi:short-subunit dehydrogenase